MRSRPAAACIALVAAVAAVAASADLAPDLAPYAAGCAGVAGLAGALLLLHGRRWPLDGEVALYVGIALQYLIAPMAHRLFTDGFRAEAWMLTDERAYVKGAYPAAMLVVMIFAAALFATMRLAGPRADARTAWTPAADAHVLRVILALAAVVWAVRLGLLATGSYYHIHRTDFQLVDWRFSAMSQINGTFGLVVLASLLGLTLAGGVVRGAWMLAYAGLDLLWNFASGSREPTLLVGLALVLAYVLCRRRWPLRTLTAGVLIALPLIGFMDFYRYAVRDLSRRTELRVGRVGRAVDLAAGQARATGAVSVAMRSVSRLNDLESIAALCLRVPRYQPHLDGETYATVPAVFVPRMLWPDKPSMVLPLNRWFFRDEGGSCPVTTMGEGYLNFGAWGVAGAGIAAGLLLAAAERYLRGRRTSAIALGFYVCFLLTMSRLHTQSLATWLGTLGKLCLALAATHALWRVTREEA